MLAICRSKRNQRGTVMILITLMLMTIFIPMAGLAIDLTIMYIVQAKLWEAVDGAGLAAGRLIGTTSESIGTLAQEVCQTNFPSGYWGSTFTGTNLGCTSTYTQGSAAQGFPFYVNVSATALTPTLFMRVFGVNGVNVAANAQVTRRMARIEIVLDRSGSMSGEISNLKTQVASFVSGFTEGYDEMGLVVFGVSGIVSYPFQNHGPYDFNPLHYTDLTESTCPGAEGGPDSCFQKVNPGDPDGPVCCDMIYSISKINSAGNTNMSDALSLAKIELLRAHYRDLNANSVDVYNNIIVLFTDGVPNMFSAYVNAQDPWNTAMAASYGYVDPGAGVSIPPGSGVYPVPNVLSPGNSLWPTKLKYPVAATFTNSQQHNNLTQTTSNSPCYYNPTNVFNAGTNPNGVTLAQVGANQMIGGMGDSSDDNGGSYALTQLASLDIKNYTGGSGSSSWSLQATQNDEMAISNNAPLNSQYLPAAKNCNGMSWTGWPANNNQQVVNNNGYMDLKYIPPWDLYGNATTDLGQGHTISDIVAPKGTTPQSFPTGTTYTASVNSVPSNGLSVNPGQNNNDAGNGAQLQIAAWNAVDNAANNIRNLNDTNGSPMLVTIYTIGYTGDGGTDGALLMRVANDVNQLASYGSSLYNPSQRAGTYYQADNDAGISSAFNKIKGLLLEISK
jgi:Flp pilus assembly protein TadG